MKSLLIIVMAIFYCQLTLSQKLWGDLKPGNYPVGVKFIKQQDINRNNRPLIISIWYPAKKSGASMLFKRYLTEGIIKPGVVAPTKDENEKALDQFKQILEMPRLGIGSVSAERFTAIMDLPVNASTEAVEADGKFPLIIMSSEPESLSVTAEFLASHGFVVAAVNGPYDTTRPAESHIWTSATDDLEWLLKYAPNIKIADTSRIGGFGFGGGILPAFLLTMRGGKIKALVNLEGAVFQPFTLTTKSIDYHPGRMRIPMLHIVTMGTKKDEDGEEMNVLRGPLYRIRIENPGITHHDFSIFGRVANQGLQLRQHIAGQAEIAYTNIHELILEFLNTSIGNSKDKFKPISKPEIFATESIQ